MLSISALIISIFLQKNSPNSLANWWVRSWGGIALSWRSLQREFTTLKSLLEFPSQLSMSLEWYADLEALRRAENLLRTVLKASLSHRSWVFKIFLSNFLCVALSFFRQSLNHGSNISVLQSSLLTSTEHANQEDKITSYELITRSSTQDKAVPKSPDDIMLSLKVKLFKPGSYNSSRCTYFILNCTYLERASCNSLYIPLSVLIYRWLK